MKTQRQTERSCRQPLRTKFLKGVFMLVLTASMLSVLPTPCKGQEGPRPDPVERTSPQVTRRPWLTLAVTISLLLNRLTKQPPYARKKKDFDDYQGQAAKEPLAVKLADAVGHVRVATNFAWTLNTGYLVLFMQAGFALLTCGLVRKKNAGHLMMLNFAAYVFAFIAYYAVGYAFQFGAVAGECPRPRI